MSPLLLYALKSRISTPFHNGIKSDIWSLGMTILSIATKIDFEFFYDWSNYRVRYDQIKRRFDDLRRKGITEDLVWLLSEMLEETEERRIDLESIEAVLKNVQDEEDLDTKIVSPESKEKREALEFLNDLEDRKTLRDQYGNVGAESIPIKGFTIQGRFQDGECKPVPALNIPESKTPSERNPLKEI
jgi:serine/threonine protein kinase